MRGAIRIDSASLSLSREVQFACNFAAVNWLWRNRSAGPSRLKNSQVAESDFTTLLAESEAGEKESQASYDKLTEQNTITKTANTEEVKGKEASVKSEETALLNYKEDFATTGKELDAVLAYLDKLKPQCETKAHFGWRGGEDGFWLVG